MTTTTYYYPSENGSATPVQGTPPNYSGQNPITADQTANFGYTKFIVDTATPGQYQVTFFYGTPFATTETVLQTAYSTTNINEVTDGTNNYLLSNSPITQGQTYTLDTTSTNTQTNFVPAPGHMTDPTCFVEGSLIRTTRGDIAVETLAIGDLVVTASGAARPIKWIGHRDLDCARHPEPEMVQPFRVAAGALGAGQPYRDLMLSPHHSVAVTCVSEHLVPIRLLANGSTIVQVETDHVSYWHIELDSHDIILANGLAAESYVDVGNRREFEGEHPVVLHPRFKSDALAGYCRPLLTSGSILSAVRSRIAALAGETASDSPNAPFHLLVDGVKIAPVVKGGAAAFCVPAGAQEIRLVSHSWSPRASERSRTDDRTLGLLIRSVSIDDTLGCVTDIRLDDPGLGAGFHVIERGVEGSWRWTDGDATLSRRLWADCPGPSVLRLTGEFARGLAAQVAVAA